MLTSAVYRERKALNQTNKQKFINVNVGVRGLVWWRKPKNPGKTSDLGLIPLPCFILIPEMEPGGRDDKHFTTALYQSIF